MKYVWILSFYYEPDLSAGSFRNTTLVDSLIQESDENVQFIVITSLPNRYKEYSVEAEVFEVNGRLTIHRIKIPGHSNGMLDQALSYMSYVVGVIRILTGRNVDLVYASSGRLFTGVLGAIISLWKKAPLYLDIRDIFLDTISDVLKKNPLKYVMMLLIKPLEMWTINRSSHLNIISGGFKEYFSFYKGPVTTFTNGIDDMFIGIPRTQETRKEVRTILYAGNIGESQGLERIVPAVAKRLGEAVSFRIIGSGGTREKLEQAVEVLKLSNVTVENPIPRADLTNAYIDADYLFLHLNDYEAFRKVLPSKIFEYASTDKPIIAGVSGYAAEFLRENVPNLILFDPCDADRFVTLFNSHPYRLESRDKFINSFKRQTINTLMAESILSKIKN